MDHMSILLELGIAYAAISMPVFIFWVILYYTTKMEKDKYAAMVEISKNLEDPSEIGRASCRERV